MKQIELTEYLNELYQIKRFQDYGPNGLQIEGREEIKKIAFSVSATLESIEAASSWGADALITHHGLFWKFHGVRTLTGPFGKRVVPLIKNDINLYGIHLPMDAHPEIGHAAVIARQLGLKGDFIEENESSSTEPKRRSSLLRPFGDYKGMPTGVWGEFDEEVSASDIEKKLEEFLEHKVITSLENKMIKSIGIITGGANGGWLDAYKLGLDAYITGEISEHDWHDSKEHDVCFFAGGHNATEKGGVKALLEHVKLKFDTEVKFFESVNPA